MGMPLQLEGSVFLSITEGAATAVGRSGSISLVIPNAAQVR